jgi:ribosome maturation protein SDO1
MALKQPQGVKLLSNVSILKLDRRGNHFEIAVFPNKVSSWRSGLETDIDEVVQSHSIFVNVDQGMLAKSSVVLESLQVKTTEEALRGIVAQGKLKLAEKERRIKIANITRDIASIVASQCVNSNTQRPLTATLVERAMKTIGFSVKLKKAPKAQALQLIRHLQKERYPITRARIRLRFSVPPEHKDKLIEMLPIVESVEEREELVDVVAQVDPGNLRPLATELSKVFGTDLRIDILELNVRSVNTENGDDQILDETPEVAAVDDVITTA